MIVERSPNSQISEKTTYQFPLPRYYLSFYHDQHCPIKLEAKYKMNPLPIVLKILYQGIKFRFRIQLGNRQNWVNSIKSHIWIRLCLGFDSVFGNLKWNANYQEIRPQMNQEAATIVLFYPFWLARPPVTCLPQNRANIQKKKKRWRNLYLIVTEMGSHGRTSARSLLNLSHWVFCKFHLQTLNEGS